MRREDWARVGLAGRVILIVVTLHGITSRRWRQFHTIGTALSIIATVGPLFVEET
jgi:hypothetical protein